MADQLSRRRALKILVGTASAAASLPVIGEGAARVAGPVCHMARPAAELPTHHPQFFRTEQIRAKDLWTQGLAFLNGVAQQEHGKNFEDCTADQQVALVERMSRNEDAPTRPEERFFVTAKRATIDGYYTSAIGIHQDLQYQGNTALAEFPGCTHPEHKV